MLAAGAVAARTAFGALTEHAAGWFAPHEPEGPADTSTDGARDPIKEAVGFDYGRYGATPSGRQTHSEAFAQGYRSARAQFDVRPATAAPFIRVWLAHRWSAAEKQLTYSDALTPEYLREIYGSYCPITRERLPVPGPQTRLGLVNRGRGYVPGNVVAMSDRAHHAFSTVRLARHMLEIYRKLLTSGPRATHLNLNACEWLRAATIASFGSPSLGDGAVSRWPLAAFPPPGLAVESNAWAFKLACSDAALAPDRGGVEHLVPEDSKPAFESFARALRLAATVPCATADLSEAVARRFAAEDAWTDTGVNQRWAEFVAAYERSTAPPSPVPHAPRALIAHRAQCTSEGI